jgi:hypothetical protein
MTGTNGQAVADLQGRFAAWRRNRPHRGSRIPEILWGAAVQLAREWGVSQTSQRLGLDYYSLKRRLQGKPPAAIPARPVEFVEIPGKVLSAGPGCVVELQDPKGLRLRVELRDAAGAESVARSLWRARR